jgi:pyridoxal phosphate enzyme (YggS family)
MEEKMSIRENIEAIKKELPDGVRLVAVTKYHTPEETVEVIRSGVDTIAENKVQDLLRKQEIIKDPVTWHFIGHLQQNKVKQLIGKVSLIQSVDSMRILKKINTESEKEGIVSDILIEYNLTGEASKTGFREDETEEWIQLLPELKNVFVHGLMGMGPNTDDTEAVHKVFRQLASIYDRINHEYKIDNLEMKILSMGMSGDYPIAVEEGANLVRIGSKIFS